MKGEAKVPAVAEAVIELDKVVAEDACRVCARQGRTRMVRFTTDGEGGLAAWDRDRNGTWTLHEHQEGA